MMVELGPVLRLLAAAVVEQLVLLELAVQQEVLAVSAQRLWLQ